MKKFIITFLILILFPVNVYATTISSANIIGPNEAKPGDEIIISYVLNFQGLDRTNPTEEGISDILIKYKVDDSNILIPRAIDTDTPTVHSTLKENPNMNVIITDIDDYYDMPNKCADDYFYCGNTYTAKIKYYVMPTEKDSVTITFESINASVIDVSIEDIKEEDIKTLNFSSNKSHTIKIQKPDSNNSNPIEEPKSITEIVPEEEIKKENTTPTIPKKSEASPTKPSTNTSTPSTSKPTKSSSNTNLKSLKVKGYDFEFQPDKHDYAINIDRDTKSVEVELELEDEKSIYTITGADDLKKNDNKVTIEVTGEDGSKQTYNIEAFIKKEKKESDPVNIFGYDIEKRYIKYGIIALVVIVILIIIKIIFISLKEKYSNRKIKKALKQIDKK